MPIAWFLCPYRQELPATPFPTRYCAMNDFNQQIRADGGRWRETEILGNRAIVKVRASVATLTTIAGTPTFRRIPRDALNDPLSTLTNPQRNALRNEILDAGYTTAEVNARFPNLANNTLGDVLRFMATRRLKPRWEQSDNSIVLDGPVQQCKPVDLVNEEVT